MMNVRWNIFSFNYLLFQMLNNVVCNDRFQMSSAARLLKKVGYPFRQNMKEAVRYHQIKDLCYKVVTRNNFL